MNVSNSQTDIESLPTLTFWALPARAFGDYLRRLIRDLAARYDAPVFEPHVTLFGAPAVNFASAQTVMEELAGSAPFSLRIRGIDHSDKFTKTVFVDLAATDSIGLMHEKIRVRSGGAEHTLKPHISLIYKTMTAAERGELARSIQLPFDQIEFDSVCAMRVPAKISSRSDVESWREAAEPRLLLL